MKKRRKQIEGGFLRRGLTRIAPLLYNIDKNCIMKVTKWNLEELLKA